VIQQSTVSAVSACIEQAVHLLMCSPEDFYEVANYLTAQLAEMIQDDNSLTVVVDNLVDQVVYFNNLIINESASFITDSNCSSNYIDFYSVFSS